MLPKCAVSTAVSGQATPLRRERLVSIRIFSLGWAFAAGLCGAGPGRDANGQNTHLGDLDLRGDIVVKGFGSLAEDGCPVEPVGGQALGVVLGDSLDGPGYEVCRNERQGRVSMMTSAFAAFICVRVHALMLTCLQD